MDNIIKADLYRYGGLSGFKGFLKGLAFPGFRFTYFFRKTASCTRYSPAWIFYSLLKRHYMYKYGFQIEATTKIGEGFFIGHFGTIIINEKAVIGKNCNLSPNVTIGQTNRGKRRGCPTIGDRVWIGSGAVVVGKITIGSNVLIAPNAYVNVDVPSNSLVMGNPCQIISKEDACENYVAFTLD